MNLTYERTQQTEEGHIEARDADGRKWTETDYGSGSCEVCGQPLEHGEIKWQAPCGEVACYDCVTLRDGI